MGLFQKYLDKDDKAQLRIFAQQINSHRLDIRGLELLQRQWVTGKLKKYGLDINKQWSVDAETGQIKEVKEEKKDGI